NLPLPTYRVPASAGLALATQTLACSIRTHPPASTLSVQSSRFKVQGSRFAVSSSVPSAGSTFDVSLPSRTTLASLCSLCFLLLSSFPSLSQNSALIRSVSAQFLFQDARGAAP